MNSVRRNFDESELRRNKQLNGDRAYQQCTLSLMDTVRTEIQFDENGVSNYFHDYRNGAKKYIKEGDLGLSQLSHSLDSMRADGKNKIYDCILGISGGVDSTYLALNAKKWGLRTLCVHFDNGWNSELATENIENIVNRCGFDLHTEVMDWNEFKQLQKAYFSANVIDIEAVTDIGIFAALDRITKKFDCHHILDGRNFKTESVLGNWTNKNPSNLLNIAQAFSAWPIRKFPMKSRWDVRRLNQMQARIKRHNLLDWIDYDKKKAKQEIIETLGWRDYGGKHYESVFTRFYQGYILPEKFGVDKRKAHLSNLIFSNQITKEEALDEIQEPIYPNELLKEDFQFVLKKLDFTEAQFYNYIDAPEISHAHYGLTRSPWKDWRHFRLHDFVA